METPLIFFDGVCGLCNGFVDFVRARDPRNVFRFAALQGETAAARVPADARENASLVLLENGRVQRGSEAALRIVERLGGIWRLARLLRFIPRFAREPVYRFIARRRYRWFGRRAVCRAPLPAERAFFLP